MRDTARPVQSFNSFKGFLFADKIEGFMPLILVTNDDGVTSEGIHALADAMRPLGDVLVVAPLQEASAIGHALTLRRPLRINKGWNLGDDITYSGTVSGALEGALLGPPGIAVSVKRTPTYDFGPSAAAGATVAAAVLAHGLPPRTFININVPHGTPKGMRVTTQAKRNHVTKIDARTDPRGGAYYWIEEALDEYHPDSGRSDHEAVKEGYISVTPLQPDMTAYDVLETLVAHLK
jgi:5'-nucleotidase